MAVVSYSLDDGFDVFFGLTAAFDVGEGASDAFVVFLGDAF